ncbi:MAG: DNA-processing protein DprA [Candidatus Obscuribacterales bacterium]|nr:DNA-processing protein DprA [Candidatus Obscuribacterales bacterium]
MNEDLEGLFNEEQEIAHWLAFDQIHGIGVGCKKVQLLFEYFGSLRAAWQARQSQLADVRGITREMASAIVEKRPSIDPEGLLETCKKERVEALPFFHPLYPSLLRGIDDPPLVLYLKGLLAPEHLLHSIAVVGTRKPTVYGRECAKELARDLATSGVTVVSGMAVGVDSLAHWGAIEAGGKTIAVLACGPDICYPSSNRPLYDKLINAGHGAVVSEFFPGTRPEPWRFPARNRIISGLSRGVVVVEAGEESGALITAEIAFSQGHATFAIPGRIDSPMSIGCNKLIMKSKAQLIRNANDIMTELEWATGPRLNEVPCVVQLFGREKEIFDLISPELIHFDQLCEKSGMAPGELSATLTMLELAGIVGRQPGDWYQRSSNATVMSAGPII